MLLLYTSTHNKHCMARHGSFHTVEKKADEYSYASPRQINFADRARANIIGYSHLLSAVTMEAYRYQ